MCGEAQLLFIEAGEAVASNAPVPGASADVEAADRHRMIDLGDDTDR